jgi:site-specific recombinase XerD
MITMKNWRERMSEDMRLRDLRPRTVEGYLLAIRLFLERVGKAPEELSEADIRGYILHLRDDRRQAPSSINIAICALRFFFNFTLQQDYEVFALRRSEALPRSVSHTRTSGVARCYVSTYPLGQAVGRICKAPGA